MPLEKQVNRLGNEGVYAALGFERQLFQFAMFGRINPSVDSFAPCSTRAALRLRRRERLLGGYWLRPYNRKRGGFSGGGLYVGGEIWAFTHVVTFSCFLVYVKTRKHIFIFSYFQLIGKPEVKRSHFGGGFALRLKFHSDMSINEGMRVSGALVDRHGC